MGRSLALLCSLSVREERMGLRHSFPNIVARLCSAKAGAWNARSFGEVVVDWRSGRDGGGDQCRAERLSSLSHKVFVPIGNGDAKDVGVEIKPLGAISECQKCQAHLSQGKVGWQGYCRGGAVEGSEGWAFCNSVLMARQMSQVGSSTMRRAIDASLSR